MKRLVLIIYSLVLALITCASTHSYTTESALKSGNIIKIRVSQTGIHVIPYDSLKVWGLNAENVCVLGYGGAMLSENFTLHHYDDLPAVAIYMHKGNDNTFNSGDYILFYAQGPIDWKIDTNGYGRHIQNPYSNYGYYFVTDNPSLQRTIAVSSPSYNEASIENVDWYTAYLLHEKDELNLIDVNGVNGGGREFYGELMNNKNKSLTISLPAKNVRTDMQAHCKVDLAATSGVSTLIQVNYAGKKATTTIPAINSDAHINANTDSALIDVLPRSSQDQQIEITFNSTSSNASAYLNYIEFTIPCELVMADQEMHITNSMVVGTKPAVRYHLKGANSQTQVWRVTDKVVTERMHTEFDRNILSWVGNNTSVEKYIAFNPTMEAYHKPTTIGKIANQNLHQLEDIDYVIICPSEFVAAAERLAKKHEEIDYLTWAVVTDQQVYNEFSSGTPDASAYRWLMKMLYDRAEGSPVKAPKHLLLLGDGSYDNRKILATSGSNILLTYQTKNSTKETEAYAMDDYFAFLKDNAGVNYYGIFEDTRALADISVGRLPVKTLEEANQVVNKICAYIEDQSQGKWKSQILFLADDGDHGLHVSTAEAGAIKLSKKNKDFNVAKIYLDAYTQEVSAAGERYPLAKNQFDNMLNNGVLFLNYSGHGGYNNITNELFMQLNDIKRMNNANQAFWFFATCSFSHFDGGITSAGEEAVTNPNGGAIGVLSASRTVYANQNTKLNEYLCDTILGHKDPFNYHMTIGQATCIAKNQSVKNGDGINTRAYVLLADPAIRLHYPTDYQVKTTIVQDTLQALTIQNIKGFIETEDHDTAYWFNGKLDVTIMDKMQEITTRDNDELSEEEKVKINYQDYPNTLFIGQTDVVDGKFEFTFMVPKDIRYNYGNGRIQYYAHDTITHEEAIGHYEKFIIGGSSSLIAEDSIGPEVNIYLNNPYFINGDDTHERPHFFAEIYDENGINTAGTGIGHDLLLVIDEDAKQTFVLNSYFKAYNNSYQQGFVSYQMAEQEEGAHSLTFRAWDLHNNSSTAALNFHVVKGLDPQLYSITTYPNPVASTGTLNIEINHDRPDDIVEYTVYLYDISGKMVYAHTQTNNNTIQWNMGDINTSSGIYVYQVNIKTQTSNFISKAGKIIITQ